MVLERDVEPEHRVVDDRGAGGERGDGGRLASLEIGFAGRDTACLLSTALAPADRRAHETSLAIRDLRTLEPLSA
jgi:hypothetical protein